MQSSALRSRAGDNAHGDQHLHNVSGAVGPPERGRHGDPRLPGAAEPRGRHHPAQRRPASHRRLHRRIIHARSTQCKYSYCTVRTTNPYTVYVRGPF